jgi:di/tricarboxylate transporter
MTVEIIIVLIILISVILLLVLDLFRIDVVALLCLLALSWSGILEAPEVLSGFASNAVIAMLSVMILGHGIAKSGIMDRFSKRVADFAGDSRPKITAVMATAAGSMSAVIQNIGAAALLLPAILNIARRKNIPPSQFIMPVGFAAILGGTLTMVGSGPLILVNDLLATADLDSYQLFAVTPVGLTLLISGISLFLIAGQWILPQTGGGEQPKTTQQLIVDKWQLPITVRYFLIPADSPMAGQTAEALRIWDQYQLNVLGVAADDGSDFAPWREARFAAGQQIALLGNDDPISRAAANFGLQELAQSDKLDILRDPTTAGFAELMIPPRSPLVGKSLRQMRMRKRYSVEPILLIHKGENVHGDFSDVTLAAGDTFVVYGLWDNLEEVRAAGELALVTELAEEKRDYAKSGLALAAFLLAIGLALSGATISVAFLTGAVAMILLRVMTIDEAYRAVDWKVVFFLAGLIPLGTAMQKTGAAQFLAESVMTVVVGQHPLLFLAAVAIITTLFSLFMSNVGATVILVPLAISMAQIFGVDPRPVALLVAVMAANSFLLPTHQVNAFYKTPGGYQNADYLKAGGILTILFLCVAVTMFYFFYL